jgi:hypothetical protein
MSDEFEDPEDTAAKMTLADWRAREGLQDEDALTEFLSGCIADAVCPTLCESLDCDDVEPDGECRHGHPSVLREMGLI